MGGPWLLQWRVSGRPVRVHATIVLGAVLAGTLMQSTDAVLAYGLLVAAHLAGHALLCRRYEMAISRIDVHGFGGDVVPQGRVRPGALAAIGVGGVGIHLLIALALALVGAESGFWYTLAQLNLLMGALNLLPLRGSDGRFLWTLMREYAEQETVRKKQHWQSLLDADQARSTITPPRSTKVSLPRHNAAREKIIADSLRAASAAELSERDARADAGIPGDLSDEVASLLQSAFTAPPASDDHSQPSS